MSVAIDRANGEQPSPPLAERVAVAFPGATLWVGRDHLLVEAGRALAVVSSAAYGGGWLRAKRILSVRVTKDIDCSDPAAVLDGRAVALHIDRPLVGLLTSLADLRRAAIVERSDGGISALVVVTAGVSNAANAARSRPAPVSPGTINTIVLVDAQPSPGALVNLVLTATEAKTLALVEHDVRTADGLPATGTSTDAIVIGATQQGEPHPYGGPATPLGALVGRAVYEATVLALRRNGVELPERRRP